MTKIKLHDTNELDNGSYECMDCHTEYPTEQEAAECDTCSDWGY